MREFALQSNDDGELKCNTDEIARFFSQAFNFILITVTTFFAIRTRNIPCAFGEAKYMFWAMLSNWVVGLAFAITHYTNLLRYWQGQFEFDYNHFHLLGHASNVCSQTLHLVDQNGFERNVR